MLRSTMLADRISYSILYLALITCLSTCQGQTQTQGQGHTQGHDQDQSHDIFVSNGSHILRVHGPHANRQVEPVISEGVSRVVGVAVDVGAGLLFWSDVDPEHRGIYRSTIRGEDPVRLVADVHVVNGLSVDWINGHVYWSDEHAQTVEMCDYRGQHRRVVVHVGLSWPRGIVVDPIDRVVFWGDQGTRQIERVNLDGTGRRTVVRDGLVWPNQLAFSYTHRRLFWVDAFNKTVESSDVTGENRRCEVDLADTVYAAPIYGLGVTGWKLYFVTYYDGALLSATLPHQHREEKETEQQQEVVEEEVDAGPIIELRDLTSRAMFSIAIADPDIQPKVGSPCSDGASGCSHVCIPTSDATYRCACPTYGNLVLQGDKRTCAAAEKMLLVADKDGGQLILFSLDGTIDSDVDGAVISEYNILASSTMPVAVAYDPVEKQVYWSDVGETTIYRMPLNGSSPEIFLNASDGVGVVDGLAVDPVSRRLYFTNMGTHVLPHAEPRSEEHPEVRENPFNPEDTRSWSRIEFAQLDLTVRFTVTSAVDKPRGLALDLDHGYLYYSDWGSDRRVVRCDLGGAACTTVLDTALTSNPNGLGYHGNRLVIADSNFNQHVTHAHVSLYHVIEKSWTELSEEVSIPFGVSVHGNHVYYTDWVTTATDSGSIVSLDTVTKETKVLLQHLSNPSGLVFVDTTEALPSEASACDLSECSHVCVGITTVRCECPDELGLVLGADNRTCEAPNDFLLYTQLNTIKFAPWTSRDPRVYTLQYGASMTSYIDVTYNPLTKDVYWVDGSGIHKKTLGQREVVPVLQWTIDTSLESQLLLVTEDPASQYLYLTRTLEGAGRVERIDVTNVTDVTMSTMETLLQENSFSFSNLLFKGDEESGTLYYTKHRRGTPQTGQIRKFVLNSETDLLLWSYEGCETVSMAMRDADLYLNCGGQITVYSNGDGEPRPVALPGFHGTHITASGNRLYYVSEGSGSILAIDLNTRDITDVVPGGNAFGRVYVHRVGGAEEEEDSTKRGGIVVNPLYNSTGESPSDGAYVVPGPRFYNCPQGELLTLQLPPAANKVKLGVELYAVDHLGETLAVSGNGPIPPGAWFTWQGKGHYGIQDLQYVATDTLGRQAVCSFKLQVVDVEPPSFINCPRDIAVNSSAATRRVWWEVPSAVDNVGVERVVEPRSVSGGNYATGQRYDLHYQVVDQSGNIGWCNFTITVNKIFKPCELHQLTQPLHGRLTCTEYQGRHDCVTSCDPDHVLNHVTDYHALQCGSDGRWVREFPKDYRAKACLKYTPIRRVERKLQFWFLGPCDPFSQSLKREIAESLVLTLKVHGLCGGVNRFTHDIWWSVSTLCDPAVLEVHCGGTHDQSYGTRSKREAASLVNIEVTLQEDASVMENLTSVEEKMNETTARMVTWYDTGTSFIVRGSTYRSLAQNDVIIEPIQLRCPLGAVWYIETCVLCPAGTRSDPLTESCVDCLPGAYQDQEGQLTCQVCPHGHMSPKGSYNITQCKQVKLPSTPVQIRDIVIAMVAGALLVVMLVVVICCCVRKKRGEKALCQGLSAAGCVKQNNPYIIDVTTGKEHLYEEIPAEDKAAAMETKQKSVPKDLKQTVAKDNDALEISQSSVSCDSSGKSSPQKAKGTRQSGQLSKKSPVSPSKSRSASRSHENDKRINAKMKQYDLHTGPSDLHPGKEEICLEVQSFLPEKNQQK